ncbi:MAG: S49 family peptidase, partial [Actinomycetota bacterium]|nr:S49 family peptidase [Actinomycetota bacterium]
SPFSAPERRALGRELGEIYDIFLRRVADGRGLERDEVKRIAEGRVWSGAAAIELGLVDRLGGPLEALERACRRAGLEPFEHPRLRVLPRPVPWARPMALVPGL